MSKEPEDKAGPQWIYGLACHHPPLDSPCECDDDAKTRVWRYADLTEDLGAVQQFHDGYPYYGTWANGRTGPMSTLDECKARVEREVRAEATP